MSDEELLKPDLPIKVEALSDEELLKPDLPIEAEAMSDEELLKPDLPLEAEAMSDEELLKPDLPEANARLAQSAADAAQARAVLEDAADGAGKPKIGFNEMAGLSYAAATGADAPENGALKHLVNVNAIGAAGFAAGQMNAAQTLADGKDRSDSETDRLLSRTIYGTIGGTVASWFSTPDVLEEWDRGEGRRYKDAAERTRARNAYAAEIARAFIRDRTLTQAAASGEIQSREKTFGAQTVADLEQNVGYMSLFSLGPVGIAAQFAASGWGKAEELSNDSYGFDADGNLVKTAEGDSTGSAIVKGFGRAGVETAVELVGGKIAGAVLKGVGGKALTMAAGKFPIAERVSGRIMATKVGQSAAKAATGINRLTSWTSKKLHLEGLTDEYLEEWLDPTIAEALGVERRGSEQAGTNPVGRAWEAQKEFFTVENQQRLLTTLVLMQGAAGFAAWCAERKRMRVVDDYLKRNGLMTDEQIASASTEEKAAAMDRHVQGMDEAEVTDTLEKTAETAEAAAKSVEEEIAGKENGEGTSAGEGASAAEDGAAKERREKVGRVKSSTSVGEQVKGVEELGVTSWQQAEEEGLVERDTFGRLEGAARRALTISLHGTARLKEAVKSGEVDGDLAEALVTAAQCELGGRPKGERDAFVDGILDRAGGDAAAARRMLAKVSARERTAGAAESVDALLDEIAGEVKAESIAERNGLSVEVGRDTAQTAVETADGEMKTLGEVVDAEGTDAPATSRKPETALDGVEQAGRLQGTRLRPTGDGLLTCETFKTMLVRVDEGGVWVSGLSADMLTRPENAADAAAVIAQLQRIAARSGLKVNFGDRDAATAASALAAEVNRQGLERTRRKLDLRSRLLDILLQTGLAAEVTTDEKSFREGLARTGNGRQFIDSHGNIYGFVEADGRLHLNPLALDFRTPIHEYGHLALEAIRRINPTLWKRGMDLVRESEYFADIKKQSQTEGHEYQYLNGRDEDIADEALATMIGDRGARLVEERGLDAKLKAWLKEVWDAFKGAFGIADLTAEQVESMTLDQFVDAVNAELMRGSEFGTRKAPPGRASVKAYDEQSADSNGLYRWAHERGCLFRLPIDRERTQPGGRVYLSTDDANITDWIESALHGVELRMSESGKIYAKGQNGLTGDLAVIFGRYPQAGENDGIYGQIADDTGHREHASLEDPQSLVDALLKDRDNYQAWKKSGGVDAETRAAEEREEFERRQAEGEARQRWEDSGLGVVEYVKSRIEEGDPAFDLDWETARELANAEAQALDEVVPYEGDVPFSVRRGEGAGAGAAARAAATGQEESVAALRDQRPARSVEQARAALKKAGVVGTSLTNERLGMTVVISNRDVAKMTSEKATKKSVSPRLHSLAVANADKVFKAAFIDGTHTDTHGRKEVRNTHRLGSAIYDSENGRFEPVMITVLEYVKDGMKMYTVEAIDVAKYENSAGQLAAVTVGERQAPIAEFVKSIANRVAEFNGGNAKFSIGNLYTGSAADYDKPSLHAVGTGEGSQVYGWGLYASSVRGVAEWYAKAGVPNFPERALKNGMNIRRYDPVAISEEKLSVEMIVGEAIIAANGDKAKAKEYVENYARNRKDRYDEWHSPVNKTILDNARKAVAEINEHGDEYSYVPASDRKSSQSNLYEQTFFIDRAPGDESHLLNWYETVSDENWDRILAQAEKEGLRDKLAKAWWLRFNRGLEEFLTDDGSDASGIYGNLSRLLGSPKAASEFLVRAGIDGVKYPVDSYGKTVKDGDKVGWNYVSFRDDNIRVDHKWTDGVAKFSASPDGKILDEGLFAFDPNTEAAFAMGDAEQRPSGIAAGIERAEALRPWTAKESPAAKAGPIAFDAADLVALWRAVSGSTRNPHVQKGERIKGRKNAVGLNVGGERIEIVSRLFGVLDKGDVAKIRADMKEEGYFKDEDPMWNGRRSRLAILREVERSQGELDRRLRELYAHRVKTGEGGGHYAAQVLSHEIGHTIANLPRDRPLGPVGDSLRTLFDAVNREFQRQASPLRKQGDRTVDEETRALIAWWHGQEKMPDYYEKPQERFAELFGIFLTQPKSVAEQAPKTYATLVKAVAQNEKFARAYERISSLKWEGKAADAFMEKVEETWSEEAQEQYRRLTEKSRESLSLKRDWFCYALNDRFGPMFNVSQRGIKAERQALDEAVREGRMSRAEADDRITALEAEVNALKTSLYDWQRQSGGATRRMVAGFADVKARAEKDGVSWFTVRRYAHCARVIELGGRATSQGLTPAIAARLIEGMRERLGAEGFAKVERTWNAFRAVYERSVLEDPNVRELYDDATMKMLMENKHYVTMKHRMGVEEAAEWEAKVDAYRRDNPGSLDPCIDMAQRLHKGLGNPGEGTQGFVLHRLVGSFESTEDPLAATIRRAIEIKESAARNHLLKQMSETLRACGVKGVFDLSDGKPRSPDSKVYGKLKYMLDGKVHELIVPSVIYKSINADRMGFGKFGEAMRFIRNTMTVWNPAFINRAYLLDKSALETNIEGMHKPLVDVISEALCFRGVGVPLYMANNYLARFTTVADTWLGRVLWNENTVNHYAHRAQKIARIVYEGKFGERLAEAQALRDKGLTADAAEIEQNVAVAEEMLKRNVFQSQYQFNREQGGLNTEDILADYGFQLRGGRKPTRLPGKAREGAKAAARWWNRFEEEQEACTKIIAYLYQMKKDEAAGRTGEADAAARVRLVIEQGGTPNLAARGVMATYVENATGFFWNVRKEGAMRTIRALKDHPSEWLTKNVAQTAAPALLKALMLTGGLETLIRAFFDDDDEKVRESWWAPAVIEHARWTAEAMKCVPGYYQRNYNMIPLAKFGDEVVSLRVKYSPEEFAIQNLVHAAFQRLGKDPTDPASDWSTLTAGVWNEFFPDLFGRNYLLDTLGTVVGPLIGHNPYDNYRERNFYDETTWKARGLNAHTFEEVGKKFWNYSPLGTFTATFKDGQERKLEDSEVPAWLDNVLSTPLLRMVPASMLAVTSRDSYLKGLKEKDEERRALARVKARDVLAESIRRGRLGGFQEALKDLPPELQRLSIRYVINGWKQYHADPKAKQYKQMRAIKDPKLKAKAMEWIDGGAKWQD